MKKDLLSRYLCDLRSVSIMFKVHQTRYIFTTIHLSRWIHVLQCKINFTMNSLIMIQNNLIKHKDRCQRVTQFDKRRKWDITNRTFKLKVDIQSDFVVNNLPTVPLSLNFLYDFLGPWETLGVTHIWSGNWTVFESGRKR